MRACVLAGITLTDMKPGTKAISAHGMTLIELVIVMAVMGILLALAVPSYQSHMLRVHRTEAIRILLQASMCQQRIYAGHGTYDTGQCHPGSEYQRYQVTYHPSDSQGHTYIAMASPKGAQLADPCGSLSLDQNGARSISGADINVLKCWNGR